MKWLGLLLLAGLLFAGGWAARGEPPTRTVTQTDTLRVTSPELERRARELELQVETLHGRLEARQRISPTAIYQAPEITVTPATPMLALEGRSLTVVSPSLPGPDSSRVSQIAELELPDNCDDGLSVTLGGQVVCDPARLGHLSVHLGAALPFDSAWTPQAYVGASWQPSFRSRWRVAWRFDGRHELAVERAFRLF